jgi:hypothetical protein
MKITLGNTAMSSVRTRSVQVPAVPPRTCGISRMGSMPAWYSVLELNGHWREGKSIDHQVTIELQWLHLDWNLEGQFIRTINNAQKTQYLQVLVFISNLTIQILVYVPMIRSAGHHSAILWRHKQCRP